MKNKRQTTLHAALVGLQKETAEVIASKLRLVQRQRGVTVVLMAKQIGISRDLLNRYLGGKQLPGPEEADRMYRWMTENISYEKAPTVRSFKRADSQYKRQFTKMSFMVPKTELDDLQAVAFRTNCSKGALMMIAMRQFLYKNNAYTAQVKAAAEDVQEAQLAQYFVSVPAASHIMKCDIEALERIKDTKVKKIKGPEALRAVTPVDKLADLLVVDGAAEEIYLEHAEDWQWD